MSGAPKNIYIIFSGKTTYLSPPQMMRKTEPGQ
ncbi:Uncharacterised protein [Brucella intermedia]|nr:Uncharacterised protein [Brucella intermedia]